MLISENKPNQMEQNRVRNRWALAYTLVRNPSLMRDRHHTRGLIRPRPERVISFIKRGLRLDVKNRDQNKVRKSLSTPNLIE